MSLLQNSNAISAGGYNIANSLRFQSASSQYLTRTPASNGNLRKWTYSAWVKRGLIGSASQNPTLISATVSASFNDSIYFVQSTDVLVWNVSNTLVALQTTQVFRDPSAWYHIVLVWDTDNATAANRARIYVNGSEVTAFSIDNRASISAMDSTFNRGSVVNYFGGSSNPVLNFDGYQTEVNFIDGEALTPSSFGETNTLTGQWVAKKYTGTYGTNGFYLPFSNGTSTTTLGADSSGNGNNWTLTNFTRSAGVSDCWMKDVPSGNGGASATQPNSNYATLNPLLYQNANTASLTLGGGNLTASRSTTAYGGYGSTMTIPTSGKYAIKFKFSGTIGASVECYFGVAVTSTDGLTLSGSTSGGAGNYYTTASIQGGGGQVHYNKAGAGDTTHYNPSVNVANNDEFEFLIDRTNGTIDIKKNGSTYGTQITGMPSTQQWFPFVSMYGTQTIYFISNFTPSDTSYKCLCTANLTSDTVATSGSFVGNVSTNGPFIWCNGTPETLTINGNAVTWGTHADRLANGFKLRTASTSYNSTGTNTWTATILSPSSKSAFRVQNAKGNP